MEKKPEREEKGRPAAGLTDSDVLEAMKSLSSYIDITPGDFRELYGIAFRLAVERFTRSVTARDIMNEKVVSVTPGDTLEDVVKVMSAAGVSGVPVVEADGKVLGVISEKDIIRRMLGGKSGSIMTLMAGCLRAGGCMCMRVRDLKADAIMTSPAVTVRVDATLAEMADILSGRKVNRLPVTDNEGRLLGILARNDIVNAMMNIGSCS
ncbi:MAG: domain containing rane protein [Deltaproteobacteria bacterium]|nr:domain containing rane protein [Deltaproteobacteria bacterium]